jgi:uncharacterized protein involved in exopolysaccharide biosynthesis
MGLLNQTLQLRQRERSNLADQQEILLEAQANPDMQSEADLSPEEVSLIELKRTRVLRRAILSENHPEIRSLDSRIKALESVIASESSDDADTAAGAIARDAIASPIGREIVAVEKRIEGLDVEIADLTAEIDVLAKSIAETPNVEMALRTLDRDYDGMKAEFQVARNKLASAATGEELELKQQAERFDVVEQATVPENPVSPNRPMIMMAGAVGGVGMGLALIILMELTNKAVRRPSEFGRIDIVPIAIIPFVFTDKEMQARRRLRVSIVLGAIALIGTGAYVVHYHILPLDLLLERILEKAKIDSAIEMVRSRLNF